MSLIGCKSPEPVTLYLHCSPVFWNLMQEEAAAFQLIYGNRIVLLPIQIQQMEEPKPAEATGRRPAPWRSRPVQRPPTKASDVVLAPAISHLISTLREDGRGDMYFTDSALQIQALNDAALVSYQYPCCYLTMVLLVPQGNPLKIESVQGMVKDRRRLGILNPAIDGSGLNALDIISKASTGMPDDLDSSRLKIPETSDEQALNREASKGGVSGKSNAYDTRDTLCRSFDRLAELLEALESGEIEAALVWNGTDVRGWLWKKYGMTYASRFTARIEDAKQRNDFEALNDVLNEMHEAIWAEKAFTETVTLTEEQHPVEISLISLSSSLHDRYNRRFADFLISSQGRKILKKYGFVPRE